MVKSQTLCYTTPRRCGMRKLEGQEKEESRIKANQRHYQWQKENLENLSMRLAPGTKDKLNSLAQDYGYSLRGFIVAIANGELTISE